MDINMEEHNTILKVNNWYQGLFYQKVKYQSLYPKSEVHSRAYIDSTTFHPSDYGLVYVSLMLNDYSME